MKKKMLSLALALALCLGLAVPTAAANTPLTRAGLAVLLAPYVESNGKGELPSDCAGLSGEEKDAITAVLDCCWMYTDENEHFLPNETVGYTSAASIISLAIDPDLEFSTSPKMPHPMADDSEWEEYRRMDLEWLEQMRAQFPNVPDWIKVYVEILNNKGLTEVQTVDDWNETMDTATAARWIKTLFSSAEDITGQPENPGTSDTPNTPIEPMFTDVAASAHYADAVQWAVRKNITNGTSKTTFSPNNTCSKAQILTFLWHANGSPEPTAANPFNDIKTTDYYYKAALWAAEKGLVSGSTFGANIDCTRAMTMEYMWKAAGSPAPAGKADFADVPANADYAQAVAWAVEREITSGTGNGNFSPSATCTRGQIVTFLYRAMGQ